MKACSLLVALILCTSALPAQTRAPDRQAAARAKAAQQAAAYAKEEKEAVDYVKALDVKTLDPSLPSQSLGDWLTSGSPHIDSLKWMLDDTCDIRPFGGGDYPRCLRIEFARGGLSGYFLVLIGTLKRGIIGPPKIYFGFSVQEEPFVQSGSTDKLSGLPDLLNQPLVATPVSKFYEVIAARHPFGIPGAADQAAIRPFLSSRLAQHLQTAKACQNDYFRQQPSAGSLPKPAWMTRDLFSGEDNRAAAFFVNTNHKEPLKDGSFEVQLSADEHAVSGKNSSIVAGGITAYRVQREWAILATVVPENNRFVVDDLRIFEDDSTDGPSRLLSEAFAGCDGPRWTGKPAESKPPVPRQPPAPIVDWDAVNVLRSAAANEEAAFTKSADVHQLDPSLPSQRLEDWLKSPSLHIDHVEWDPLHCNIKEGSEGATRTPERGLCAEVWFQRGNARARIRVRRGLDDSPSVNYIGVSDKYDGVLTPISGNDEKPSDANQLSALPRLLEEQSVIDVTRNLYDSIVAHHPLGIPKDQDKASISPLLTKRLNQQLAAAQACQTDFLHQSPSTTAKPRPAWLDSGLFTGPGDLALPTAALVDHKERQPDGSFLVNVWLSRKGPAPRWINWHVTATVKPEDGHFVVDDVRIFDGLSKDSPSHRLSDTLANCDGPQRPSPTH